MNNQPHSATHSSTTQKCPRQLKQRILKLILFCGFCILYIFILATIDSRTASNHKPWHSDLTIAAFNPDGSFLALPYSYIQQHPLAGTSFLAKNTEGSKQKNDNDTFKYTIIEQSAQYQQIRTSLRTNRSMTIAIYQATAHTVTPIKSISYNIEQISMAAVMALISVLILQFAYRLLGRHTAKKQTR